MSAAYQRVDGLAGDLGASTITTTGACSFGATTCASARVSNCNSVGLAHFDADGDLTSSLLVNADVSASAAIATSKLAGSGLLRTISFTIAQAATTDSTATLPANAIVHNCQVIVTTQYSASGTIAVGQSGSTTAFQATTDNDADGATANDIFEKVQYTTTSAAAIRATVGGSPAAGAARIVVFYSVPEA